MKEINWDLIKNENLKTTRGVSFEDLLNTSTSIEDMDLPGFRLHQLKGNRKELWAIDVSKNWRIVFRFEEGNVYVVDYEDYH